MFPTWDELVRSRRFWLSYISAGVEISKCPTLRSEPLGVDKFPICGVILSFMLPDSFVLRLEVPGGEHRILLSSPDVDELMLLGTMDSHQMSDLFRWEEFKAVIQGMEQNSGPTWAHELLLGFYVAVTE